MLPLDDVYDAYRTASMNEKYYAQRLMLYTRINLVYEIFLAFGASTSIAGWAVWKETPVGRNFWTMFTGIVTVLALLKPFLKHSDEIQRYSALHTGYRALHLNLEGMVSKIRRNEGLSPQIEALFDASENQHQELKLKDELRPNIKLLRECQQEVNQEISTDKLWYPPIALQQQMSSPLPVGQASNDAKRSE